MVRLHGICAPHTSRVHKREGGTTIYVVYLPRVLKLVKCPVPFYLAVENRAEWMREHFMYQHFWSQVIVV